MKLHIVELVAALAAAAAFATGTRQQSVAASTTPYRGEGLDIDALPLVESNGINRYATKQLITEAVVPIRDAPGSRLVEDRAPERCLINVKRARPVPFGYPPDAAIQVNRLAR